MANGTHTKRQFSEVESEIEQQKKKEQADSSGELIEPSKNNHRFRKEADSLIPEFKKILEEGTEGWNQVDSKKSQISLASSNLF